MATPVLGKIDEFYRYNEEWPQYVERLRFFFIANSITTAEKKRAVFLSVVGAATYKVLRNLISPELPSEKSYDELVSVLEQHYNPAPSEIVERFRFYCRARKPGESVANFFAQLRSLAARCNYGDSLENMLRDRLVCGINDDSIHKRLLAEPNLTYKKAVELARGLETADRNVKLLKSGATSHIKRETPLPESPQVNRVASNKGSTAVICYRCGIGGHAVEQCRYSKDIVCHGCRKARHLQKACKGTNPSQNRAGARKKDSHPRHPVHHIEEEGAGEEDVEEATLFRINASQRSPPIEVHLLVDNCCVRFEVDTGPAKSVMSQQIFNQLSPGKSLETTKVRLVSYSNEPIPVVSQCTVNIAYKSQNAVVPLVVVKGTGPSLFGRNWLNHIRLEWQEINYVPGDAV